VELAHKPITSIDSLFKILQDLRDEGIDVSSMIIDWWGRIRDALIMSLEKTNVGDNEIRRLSRTWLHRMRTLAKENGVKLMIFHQLAGAVAERSTKHRPSSHSAQEDKNFNNMFDYCFTGGRKDENDEMVLIADKARTGANLEVRLKLNGACCKFEVADNPNDTVSLEEPKEKKRAAMPSFNPDDDY